MQSFTTEAQRHRGFYTFFSQGLVVMDITDTTVLVHDPALETGPTPLSIDGFLLVWEEFDRLAAVISK